MATRPARAWAVLNSDRAVASLRCTVDMCSRGFDYRRARCYDMVTGARDWQKTTAGLLREDKTSVPDWRIHMHNSVLQDNAVICTAKEGSMR